MARKKTREPEEGEGGYLPPHIGPQIREARRAMGLSTREFADLAGVSNGLVGNVENGKAIRPDKLAAIAKALGAEVSMETSLRWPNDEQLRELEAVVGELRPDLRGTAIRLLRALPDIPSDHRDVLITWASLYAGKKIE